MTKAHFRALFEHALAVAADNAAKKLGRPVPRSFEIEMSGRTDPLILSQDDALELPYISSDCFYRIIDVSVVGISTDFCRVCICISGHHPGPLNETWNQPPGSGPFKKLLADEIKAL